jgi:hypothetical protein
MRADRRLAIARELERIDVHAVPRELVVQMRAGREPGRADVADDLAPLDLRARNDRRGDAGARSARSCRARSPIRTP